MIQIRNYAKRYGTKEVLKDISLHIQPGEFVTIIGPNGCGKSTLLKSIAGFIAHKGNIKLNTSNISYIGQDPKEMILPWKNIESNIIFPHENPTNPQLLSEILSLTNLAAKKNDYPKELSGGMEQLLLLGRALHNDSDIVLMDEPFKSLDHATSEKVREALLAMWKKNNSTMLLVSHNIQQALMLSDRIILLKNTPASICKSIKLNQPQHERKQTSHELLKLREEIINELQ